MKTHTRGLFDCCADFSSLSKRIEQETNPSVREWEKIRILRYQKDYLDFLSHLTAADDDALVKIMDEFASDKQFKREFSPKLKDFESLTNIVHGDIRFHSITLYVITRLLRPKWVVETGVASGKSSALILLALYHNRFGNLISIDLPNMPGKKLADGALTHTGGRPPGWLVPAYLHARWELPLGASQKILPEVVRKAHPIDIFLHDSLHTYEHLCFELDTVSKYLRDGSLILVDNVDLPAGKAFREFLMKNHFNGYCFRDFASVVIKI